MGLCKRKEVLTKRNSATMRSSTRKVNLGEECSMRFERQNGGWMRTEQRREEKKA